jgi:glycine betaine/choline ABC-type transport system substrate-binding protein
LRADLLERKADALRAAAARGAVVLGVCGGYQLLGHSYQLGEETIPGIGLLDLHTVRADEPRLIGNVAICELAEGAIAGFENHGGRTQLGPAPGAARPRAARPRQRRAQRLRGGARGSVIGTYVHGPLLPKNAWFCDWLTAPSRAGASTRVAAHEPLEDSLEPIYDPAAAVLEMPHRSRRHTMRRAAIAVTVALGLACAACGGTTRTSSTSQTTTETVATTLATTPTTSQGTATTGTGTSTTPTLPGTGKPQVTIGDKNTDEQFVIGQLYLQALQAQGFKVSLNQNIGPTEVTVQALSTGSLAMYPEYLDVFDTAIARDTRHFRTQVDAYEAAQRYARAHGLVLLPPTPFSNTEAIAVTDAYAEQNGLSSIGDLRHIAGTWTLGGPEQFQQLPPGLAQLRAAYGVTPPAFRSLAIGDQYDELDAGTIQAADVFTTDGELASGDVEHVGLVEDQQAWPLAAPISSSTSSTARVIPRPPPRRRWRPRHAGSARRDWSPRASRRRRRPADGAACG